jgi:hypothetical protein
VVQLLQLEIEVAATLADQRPMGQLVQVAAPGASANEPCGQSVQPDAPGVLKRPATQSVQVISLVAPLALLDFPAAQGVQEDALPKLKDPAGHCPQLAAPAADQFPAGQPAQESAEVLPERGLYCPATQRLHAKSEAPPVFAL